MDTIETVLEFVWLGIVLLCTAWFPLGLLVAGFIVGVLSS